MMRKIKITLTPEQLDRLFQPLEDEAAEQPESARPVRAWSLPWLRGKTDAAASQLVLYAEDLNRILDALQQALTPGAVSLTTIQTRRYAPATQRGKRQDEQQAPQWTEREAICIDLNGDIEMEALATALQASLAGVPCKISAATRTPESDQMREVGKSITISTRDGAAAIERKLRDAARG